MIGLLGGSFDPPHAGHVHITREALKRFGLDAVWWLVSPGNPLKPQGPAPLAERMAAARAIMKHPRVRISDFEARSGTRYTARTLRLVLRRFPRMRFVWLMGADNFATLEDWQDWPWIMDHVAVGVLARPGQRISARMSKAARRYRRARVRPGMARALRHGRPPCWAFVNIPMDATSSSDIRARGEWR